MTALLEGTNTMVIGRRWLCPTCRREVKPTTKGNIVAHLDSIRRDTCPSSGEPWRTTVLSDPEFRGVAE